LCIIQKNTCGDPYRISPAPRPFSHDLSPLRLYA
jgi:hypothetical protein